MPTNADLETRIVHALADAWTAIVAPEVIPRACILAARVATEVLDYFSIPHVVQPVETIAANDACLTMVLHDVPIADWPADAWNVAAGRRSAAVNGNGWPGHLAVVTTDWYLDLSATQFDRPAKHIVTGGPVVRHVDEMTLDRWFIRFPIVEGWYQWNPEDNHTYRTARDWTVNGPEFAGPVIRRLKKTV
jgi:hypothetical protein